MLEGCHGVTRFFKGRVHQLIILAILVLRQIGNGIHRRVFHRVNAISDNASGNHQNNEAVFERPSDEGVNHFFMPIEG